MLQDHRGGARVGIGPAVGRNPKGIGSIHRRRYRRNIRSQVFGMPDLGVRNYRTYGVMTLHCVDLSFELKFFGFRDLDICMA